MKNSFRKNLEAMRYQAGVSGKISFDRNNLLKTVDDPAITAVQVMEPSFLFIDGSLRKVNAGKVFRIGPYSRAEIQMWIDDYQASFFAFCETVSESRPVGAETQECASESIEAVESPVAALPDAEMMPVTVASVKKVEPVPPKPVKPPRPGVRIPPRNGVRK